MQGSTKVVIGLTFLLMFLHSPVQAQLQVTKAKLKDGFIDLRVRGAQAQTAVLWQEHEVGATRKDGRFELHTPLVPRNCIGILQIGAETVKVPVKTCQASSHFVPILATGQTQSHTVGDDGHLQHGVKRLKVRFRNNLDGTITDLHTGIRWLKQVNCLAPGTWQQDHNFAQQLQAGVCGLRDGSKPGDWAVPNVNELQSLLDYGATGLALSANHEFVGIELQSLPDSGATRLALSANHKFVGIETNLKHWTATSYAADPTKAYLIDLATAEIQLVDKSKPVAAGFFKNIKKAVSNLGKAASTLTNAGLKALFGTSAGLSNSNVTVGDVVVSVIGGILIDDAVSEVFGVSLPDAMLQQLGTQAVNVQFGETSQVEFEETLQADIQSQIEGAVDIEKVNDLAAEIDDDVDEIFEAVEQLEGEGAASTTIQEAAETLAEGFLF